MDWTILIIVVVVLVAFFAVKRILFVSAELAQKYLATGALVIDVRTAGEFNSGHVAGAVNIPLGKLAERIPQVAKDKDQVLLVHCLSGGRSALAKGQLKRMGYVNALNLGSLRRAQQIVSGNQK